MHVFDSFDDKSLILELLNGMYAELPEKKPKKAKWDRKQFILDNQEAFNYGALEEFGRRDDHFEENEQIISRETIEIWWSEVLCF